MRHRTYAVIEASQPASGTQGPETTPMSRLVSRASDRDAYRPVRPFPLVRTMLGLVAALNVTSATAMLLSL